MKVLFMGTPDFAVPVLEGIISSSKHQVVAVVTQPDKKRGRGGDVTFPPVKEVAVRENIPVLQPVKIKQEEAVAQLRDLSFDVMVVVAFGQILSKEILDMPKYGCINVHASLLPRWRGAAPIQWSILSGDEKTGITTMKLDEGVDTGDMLLQEEYTIKPDETGGSLFDHLSPMGSDLLLKTLDQVEDGSIKPIKQDDSQSTYAKMLTKELGQMDWNESAISLERKVRGLNPWPSAYTHYKGKTLKIWKACVGPDMGDAVPGTILKTEKLTFFVQTGEGTLEIKELQLEGKKRMDAGSFLRGVSLSEGELLNGK